MAKESMTTQKMQFKHSDYNLSAIVRSALFVLSLERNDLTIALEPFLYL